MIASDSERCCWGQLNVFLDDQPDTRYYETLPLLKIIPQADGSLKVCDNFIPPLASLNASQRLLNMLDTMQSAISVCQQQAEYPLSGLLIQAVVELNFYRSHPRVQVWPVYLCLTKLMSALLAYHNDGVVRLPDYQHSQLGQVMSRLESLLQAALAKCMQSAQTVAVFERVEANVFVTDQLDLALLNSTELLLKVRRASQSHWQCDEFIRSVKIGSPKRIQQLIRSALQGISVKPNQYGDSYLLIRCGEDWEAVKSERGLAVFVPDAFTVQEMELIGRTEAHASG